MVRNGRSKRTLGRGIGIWLWGAVLVLGLLSACGGELADTGATATSVVTQEIAPAVTEPPATATREASEAATAGPEGVATLAPEDAPATPEVTSTPAQDKAGEEAGLPAPQCTSPAPAAPAMTEGPYYKDGSPERTSLLEGDPPGTRLVLRGYVLATDCQPVAGAWLDFWQTDGNGEYDNAGYGMRGHQFTDENGQYVLETVIPGIYPGRTAHIHVKVQAPGGQVLTTQLFFPGVGENEGDRIFSDQLLVTLEQGEDGMVGRFDFVLEGP